MAPSLAQTAIAFLIDLAEQGEIDPWDVKVIEVIDRFLQTLKEQTVPQAEGRSAYEASLSESGQAFLYASMLVLLKADNLVRAETAAAEDEPEEEAWELLEPADTSPLPKNLERHLHRRAVAVPPRRRSVTLQELIHQLEAMADVMAEHTPKVRSRRPKSQPRRQAVRAIAQLAHQENLSEIAAALETFLDQYWDEAEPGLMWLDFEHLLAAWPQFQPEALKSAHSFDTPHAAAVHDRVGVFWGLLFLSAQSKVELSQEEFYHDLKVQNLKRTEGELGSVPPHVLPD